MAFSEAETVEVAIIGAGISGVLAAHQAHKDGLSFRIIDRCQDFGGVWEFRANSYSHLQVRCCHSDPTRKRPNTASRRLPHLQAHAAAYQWEAKYALARSPFKQVPAGTVLAKIRECASDLNLAKHTTFGTEVTRIEATSNVSKCGW